MHNFGVAQNSKTNGAKYKYSACMYILGACTRIPTEQNTDIWTISESLGLQESEFDYPKKQDPSESAVGRNEQALHSS